jgi:hypothetical protein
MPYAQATRLASLEFVGLPESRVRIAFVALGSFAFIPTRSRRFGRLLAAPCPSKPRKEN